VLPLRLTVAGRDFERVCVRRTGVGVYRGDGCYLRIGPGLGAELDVHRGLLGLGYPVAEILAEGTHDRLPYVVEESLGEATLGELFLAEQAAGEGVSNRSFALFSDVMARHAQAQVQARTPGWSVLAFADLIGVGSAGALLPDIGEVVRGAFDDAVVWLQRLPGAMLHGDLHPDNVCVGGVIDLEGAGRGVVGYDVLTAVFVPAMCAVAREGDAEPGTGFSSSQLRGYLQRMEAITATAGCSVGPDDLDALLLCRAISLCAHRHRDPDIWRARSRTLRKALEDYRTGERLAARWGLGPG
jgi:hypothetical protein